MSILPWQQADWAQLSQYIQQNRVPQALLVSGNPGLGKRALMDRYARALLCISPLPDQTACGHCVSCHLIDAATHPDYLHVMPDEPGKAIGIEKIRQLIVKLALKPQFESWRVVVIDPADQLNNNSANAFLKCLEEPTERTCIILISEQANRLPATIRSRCQKIVCKSPDRQQALQWLKSHGAEQNAATALSLAQGSPLLAKRYLAEDIVQLHQACFKAWLSVGKDPGQLLAVAEDWQKQEKIDLSVLLGWMSDWLAGIAKCAHGIDGSSLQNQDIKKPLQDLALRLELQGIHRLYHAVLGSRAVLHTQLNKQLLVERLLIDWSQLHTG